MPSNSKFRYRCVFCFDLARNTTELRPSKGLDTIGKTAFFVIVEFVVVIVVHSRLSKKPIINPKMIPP